MRERNQSTNSWTVRGLRIGRGLFPGGMLLPITLAGMPSLADDSEAGMKLAKSKGCFECHGKAGNTGYETDPPVPKLAGQPKAYLIKAMNDYRSGDRQDETMNVLMQPRTDADIELLAEYYSTQKRY